MTQEVGKLKSEGEGEVELCAAICEYCADNAEDILEDEHKEFDEGEAIISYRPLGAVFSIQPWNFPLYQVLRNSIHNIMDGNVSLTKHAKNTWGTAKMIEEIFKDSGLPENVYCNLYINHEVADKVCGVSFTGSMK